MKKVYFLSDLHLGAPYIEGSKEAERRVVRFLDQIGKDAAAIYLAGDVLDYWYEYKYVVPKGYVRFFGKLAELADAGVKITWIIGNHDIWIFDYLPSELGIEVIDGELIREIFGKNLFIAHGDGVGRIPAGFRFMRGIFRNKFCQFLYSGIHPRWTIPFATRWSQSSRKRGLNRGVPDLNLLNGLREFCESFLKENPDIDYFMFGHVHVVADEKISSHTRMIVLGEWLSLFSYAVMDPSGEITVKYWKEPSD